MTTIDIDTVIISALTYLPVSFIISPLMTACIMPPSPLPTPPGQQQQQHDVGGCTNSCHDEDAIEVTCSEPTNVCKVARRRRHVQFDLNNVQVNIVSHCETMSTEEVNATYYSKEDLREMKLKTISDAERMVQKDLYLNFFHDTKEEHRDDDDNEEEFCTRGLRPFAYLRRRHITHTARETVIQEQEFQREMGLVDDEYLADLYIITAQPSVNAATEMAIQDEIEAKECYMVGP
jgi:hypothetical protein